MPKDRYRDHRDLLNPVSDIALLSTPEHRGGRKSLTPQPPHGRNNSRASSHGSRRSQEPPPDQFKENSLNVYLHDVQHLVRKNIVGLPGGFTKSGNPVLIFQDKAGFSNVSEGDLHLLLKYFISVVPRPERAEQSPGFALVIDRRRGSLQEVQIEFDKIITLFPAKIKEVFLLYHYGEGEPSFGKLIDEYLHDFDIFHLAHATELLHYIDPKYLSVELGGNRPVDMDTWMVVQQNVDAFTLSATKCSKRMGSFVKILNKEDISLHKNRDTIREVAERNRGIYRRLKAEVESLREGGIYLSRKMQEEGANMMQRLSVEILCNQLDETWNSFKQSFKMQDKVYVQFVELCQFENEFRELVNKFSENEKIINRLIMTGFGNSLEEISKELEECENLINALAVDSNKARNLLRAGKDVMLEHPFTRESLEYNCLELKMMISRQELLFDDRKKPLIKFRDMYEAMNNINNWCETATKHMEKKRNEENKGTEEMKEETGSDILSELRQLEFLLNKSEEIKVKGRTHFEEDFVEIKDLISEATLIKVDEHISHLEEVKKKVSEKRDLLRKKAEDEKLIDDECPTGNVDIADHPDRRDKIVLELLSTEKSYVEDLKIVLTGYKQKMSSSKIAAKAPVIFGNIDEIEKFHSETLLPELENCNKRPDLLAETFLDNSQQMVRLYCRYCQNMDDAHAGVTEIGENHPLLVNCQKELGHQLPLSSYLLKPVQRLTKYQLLLKDLQAASGSTSQSELEECIEVILQVIKAVNDSLQQGNIRGLPEILYPLGGLVCQEVFSVHIENKQQSSHIFKSRKQTRQVLLFDTQLVFCKQSNEKRGPIYNFKFSLAIPNLSMSSIIKGAEKKIEIWIIGQSDVYSLEAKTKKAKEDFANELRRVIIEQKDKAGIKPSNSNAGTGYNEYNISNSGSESMRSRHSNNSGNDHLEPRSHSSDAVLDRRQCDNENLDNNIMETPLNLTESDPQYYRVLADYSALSDRELSMQEGEVVELIKIGCGGWWYVRVANYPDIEGWAPETYLERIPNR